MYWLFPSINPYISRLQIFHKEDSYDYDFDDFEHLNNPNENETNRESCTTINVLPSSKNITNIIDDNIFLDDPNFVDNLPKELLVIYLIIIKKSQIEQNVMKDLLSFFIL